MDLLQLIGDGEHGIDYICSAIDSFQAEKNKLDPILEKVVVAQCNASKNGSLDILYSLSKVRGYKVVARFFPKDVHLFLFLIDRLKNEESHWKARYILLLWLAELAVSPVDLEKVSKGLYGVLFEIAAGYLHIPGKERDAAAFLMARLVTRANSAADLQRFVEWAPQNCLGAMQAAARIAKLAPNSLILEVLDRSDSGDNLSLKFKLKALARLAVSDYSVLERAIDELMQQFENPSTQLRFTAAKGMARIVASLTRSDLETATSVMDTVNQGFLVNLMPQSSFGGKLNEVSSNLWHASLLFFAQVVKQSPELANQVMEMLLPVLCDDALHFQQRRLHSSIGSEVRDAACFVSWVLVRSLKKMPRNTLDTLYGSLVALACFDREVNIRRAAAAVLQELVGRHGGPQGTASDLLLQTIEFHSVSLARKTYLELGPKLEPPPHPSYIIQHAVKSPDPNMRRLAGEALPLYTANHQIKQQLLSLYDPTDPSLLHGVLLALANIDLDTPSAIDILSGVKLNKDTDELKEGVLKVLSTNPALLSSLTNSSDLVCECLDSSEQFVEHAALTLVQSMSPQDRERFIPLFAERMKDGQTFVRAVVACKEGLSLIPKAAALDDPASRKLAISYLTKDVPDFEKVLLKALSDYSRDKRGDVGSWVRKAAVLKIENLYAFMNPTYQQQVTQSLFRLAAEPLDSLRIESASVLRFLGVLKLDDGFSHQDLYYSLLSTTKSKSLLRGLVKSLGAQSGTVDTLEGSLGGTIRYISCAQSPNWLGQSLLGMNLQGIFGVYVLVAISRLSTCGGIQVFDRLSLSRIATDQSLFLPPYRRQASILAILGCLVDQPGVVERLLSLCENCDAHIREQAAMELVDAGLFEELLECNLDEKSMSELARHLKSRWTPHFG